MDQYASMLDGAALSAQQPSARPFNSADAVPTTLELVVISLEQTGLEQRAPRKHP